MLDGSENACKNEKDPLYTLNVVERIENEEHVCMGIKCVQYARDLNRLDMNAVKYCLAAFLSFFQFLSVFFFFFCFVFTKEFCNDSFLRFEKINKIYNNNGDFIQKILFVFDAIILHRDHNRKIKQN